MEEAKRKRGRPSHQQKYKNGSTVWTIEREYEEKGEIMPLVVYKMTRGNRHEDVYTFVGHKELYESQLYPDKNSAEVELRLKALEKDRINSLYGKAMFAQISEYNPCNPIVSESKTKEESEARDGLLVLFFILLIFGFGVIVGAVIW